MRKIWLGVCVTVAFFAGPALADDSINPNRPLTQQEQLVVQQVLTIYTLVGKVDGLQAQVDAMMKLQKKPDEGHAILPSSDK